MEVICGSPHTILPMGDASQVGAARRLATHLAATAQLSRTGQGRAALVATELATNLVRHATGGELLLRANPPRGNAAGTVELLACDTGPGMADFERCLSDGYSTGGTAGNGIGAVRRLAAQFDWYSRVGQGTVLWAEVGNKMLGSTTPAPPPPFDWAAVAAPLKGETVCGDSWCVALDQRRWAAMLADGLGHGPLAEAASQNAVAAFASAPFDSAAAIFERMQRALAGGRGAAVAVAQCDTATANLNYSGIGNIAGTLLYPDSRRGLYSGNGVVGIQIFKLRPMDYPLRTSQLFVMCSDGLQTRWNLDDYPGLDRRRPAVIAGVLHRDCSRRHDDATVLVARLDGCTPTSTPVRSAP